MSGSVKAHEISAAMGEAARLLGAGYSRDHVQPVLDTFEQSLPDAMVVFSAQTGPRYAGQLDYSLTVPAETGGLYDRAVASRLVAKSDHPAARLLPDFEARYPFSEYFVDCGAAAPGLRKLYAHFPQDQQKVAALAEIPSMPPAVTANAGLFARYGLESVAMMGVGCKSGTMSLYFQFTPDTRLAPAAIGHLLHDIGMPEPDEATLRFAHRALRANLTFDWDSPEIQRVAFAPPPGRGLDLAAVPAPVPPAYARFAATAPRAYGGKRVNLFALKWMPDGQFTEVCSYYQLSALQRQLFLTDHEEEGA